ncbi:slc44a2, partial [Symbiodinium pilosum]
CKKNSISFVIAAVKATIRILYDVPQLILLPAVGSVVRGVILIIFLWGGALLISAGEVEQVDLTQYVPKGIARSFSHTQDQTLYIVYYCFCALWMWELLLALETFVAAYTVTIWYNAPLSDGKKRVPCFPVVRAFFVGLTYHLGSLLFGAIILALFRGAYMILSFFQTQVKGNDEDENNDVARTTAACCCCCLQCVEQILRYLNKGAYVMIAVNSDNYCNAADRALRLMASNILELGLLNGATVLFQVLGNVAIPGLGGYFTYLIVRHLEQFNDPTSEHFVAQPDMVAVVGAVICFAVSLAFMSIFDTVSDAMIYAYITDEEWRRENRLPPNPNIPPNLKSLLPESQQIENE